MAETKQAQAEQTEQNQDDSGQTEAKNAEFAESSKRLDETRGRFREMLVPPGSKSVERQTPAEVTAPQAKQEDKENEKKEKGKWWQFWK